MPRNQPAEEPAPLTAEERAELERAGQQRLPGVDGEIATPYRHRESGDPIVISQGIGGADGPWMAFRRPAGKGLARLKSKNLPLRGNPEEVFADLAAWPGAELVPAPAPEPPAPEPIPEAPVFPGNTAVVELPLSSVEPDPENFRRTRDEGKLADLAESVRQHGVIEPLLVRSRAGGDGPGYRVIAGGRRYAAALAAGRATVPAIVRDDLSEEEARVLSLVENLQREDLNAMDRAAGFAALQATGLTEAQVGERVGMGQSAVSKALALLKLPEDVRALVQSEKLAAKRALALVRFAEFPAYLSLAAGMAAEKDTPAGQLEQGVPFWKTAEAAGLVVCLDHTGFDWRTVCLDCPAHFTASLGDFYYGDTHLCFRPAHHAELEREHAADRDRLREEALAAAREAAAARIAARETPEPFEQPAWRKALSQGAQAAFARMQAINARVSEAQAALEELDKNSSEYFTGKGRDLRNEMADLHAEKLQIEVSDGWKEYTGGKAPAQAPEQPESPAWRKPHLQEEPAEPEAAAEAPEAPAPEAPALPALELIPDLVSFQYRKPPPGCRLEACPDYLQGTWRGEPGGAGCRDRKCYDRLARAGAKEAKATEKAGYAERLALVRALAAPDPLPGAVAAHLIAPLVRRALHSAPTPTVKAAFDALGIALLPQFWDGNYGLSDTPQARDVLAGLGLDTLARLAGVLVAEAEVHAKLESDYLRTPDLDWLTGQAKPAPLAAASWFSAEQKAKIAAILESAGLSPGEGGNGHAPEGYQFPSLAPGQGNSAEDAGEAEQPAAQFDAARKCPKCRCALPAEGEHVCGGTR